MKDDRFEEARTLFFAGVDAFEAGSFEDAEGKFAASLAALPDRVSTLVNLGATRIKLGRPEAALDVLDRALASEPSDAEALCHRGVALVDLGRHVDALAAFDVALGIDPDRRQALVQRGIVLNLLSRHDEALAAFERLIAAHPSADAWYRHAQTLQLLGRYPEALASYERALEIDPTLAQAWSNRGGILKELGRFDEAAHALRRAIDNGSDALVDGYFLAAVESAGGRASDAARSAGGTDTDRGGTTSVAVPSIAPRRYVEQLFDDYASTFDRHLVDVLRYRGHEMLVDRLVRAVPRRFGAALDLGCGTGLASPRVAPLAASVDGVDLSKKMLGEAARLGVYRHLEHADLAAYLRTTDRRYDLVLAADVFIYVGDLTAVYAGVARVIGPGGVFCFSAEAAVEAVDFELRPSLRYAHSERYLRRLAAQHGFRVQDVFRGTIREDQARPIEGLYMCLERD